MEGPLPPVLKCFDPAQMQTGVADAMIDALKNLKHDPYPSKREAVGMKRPTALRVLILAVIIVVGVSMPTFRVQGENISCSLPAGLAERFVYIQRRWS